MIMQKYDRDCLNCCLSEILQIDYDLIPKFYEVYPKKLDDILMKEDIEFQKQFDNWLKNLGYFRILFDTKYDDAGIKIPYISLDKIQVIGVLKKENRVYSHCVILEISKKEIILLHDPKKDSDYDLSDLIKIEIFCKI